MTQLTHPPTHPLVNSGACANLRKLDLSHNKLYGHSVLSLARVLHALPRLQHLSLANNWVSAGGATELARALQVRHPPTPPPTH